jgi:hypothetical protein
MHDAGAGFGASHRAVVVDPARQPMKITRSAASITSQVWSVPPFEPTTPTALGCVSASEP